MKKIPSLYILKNSYRQKQTFIHICSKVIHFTSLEQTPFEFSDKNITDNRNLIHMSEFDSRLLQIVME